MPRGRARRAGAGASAPPAEADVEEGVPVEIMHMDARLSQMGNLAVGVLAKHNIGGPVLHKCATAVETVTERLARGPSRPAFLATHHAGFGAAALPPSEHWHLLLVPHHRMIGPMQESERRCTVFARMMVACRLIRGEPISDLFRDDGRTDCGKVDMLKVIESWQHMTKDRFEMIMQHLVSCGTVGAPTTLAAFKSSIGNVVAAYHAAADTGVPKDVGSPFHRHQYVVRAARTYMKRSPLATPMKMQPLSTDQIQEIQTGSYIGGLSMLQARFAFAHTAICGHRTTDLTQKRWRDICLVKVPYMRFGERMQGWALCERAQQDKHPTVAGTRVWSFNPMGMIQDRDDAAVIGNVIVELGLAMQVFAVDNLEAVPEGAILPVKEEKLDWFVLCAEHDSLFSPYVNITSGRLSWLMAMLGAVCGGFYAGPRVLRVSLVHRSIMQSILSGRTFDGIQLKYTGGWKQTPNAAPLSHYFSPQAAATGFGILTASSLSNSPMTAEGARAVAQTAMAATGSGRPPRVKSLSECDISVFMGFQHSQDGIAAQAAMTAASRELRESVGGYDIGRGAPFGPVSARLADLHARPGLWVLRSPMSDAALDSFAARARPDQARAVAAVRAHTLAVRAGKAAKKAWIARAEQIGPLKGDLLKRVQHRATLPDTQVTADDIAAEFPHGALPAHDDPSAEELREAGYADGPGKRARLPAVDGGDAADDADGTDREDWMDDDDADDDDDDGDDGGAAAALPARRDAAEPAPCKRARLAGGAAVGAPGGADGSSTSGCSSYDGAGSDEGSSSGSDAEGAPEPAIQLDGLGLVLARHGDALDDAVMAQVDADAAAREAGAAQPSGAEAGAAVPDPDPPPVGAPGCGPQPNADWVPSGDRTTFRAGSGYVTEVHLQHHAALGVLRARKYYYDFLTRDPDTGLSLLPESNRARRPRAHAAYEADFAFLAHDSCMGLFHTLKHVRDGSLPQVVARFSNLSTPVKRVVQETGRCLVLGCPNVAVTGKTYGMFHLCDEHLKQDVEVVATRVTMRLCTSCKKQRPLAAFGRSDLNGRQRMQCGKCSGGELPGEAVAEEARPREVAAGEDADHSLRTSLIALHARSHWSFGWPGSSMLTPYIVYATHSPDLPSRHACANICCDGTRTHGDQVRLSLCQPCLHGTHGDFRRGHFAIVYLVDEDGVPTGERMYIRFCSECWRGLPLDAFQGRNCVCRQCREAKDVYRARNADRTRGVGVEAGEGEGMTKDNPLLIRPAGKTAAGFCRKYNCPNTVERVGDKTHPGRAPGVGEPRPLCEEHMKVWFYRAGPLEPPERWCTACEASHAHWQFGEPGLVRTCQASWYKECRQAAEREAARAKARQEAASAAAPLERELRPVSHGHQTHLVDGKGAVQQLREAMGDGLTDVLLAITGSADDSDAGVDRALDAIVEHARTQTGVGGTVDVAQPQRAPTECMVCDQPTAPFGFLGRSTCASCYAKGTLGLSPMELNYILVAHLLTGKGQLVTRSAHRTAPRVSAVGKATPVRDSVQTDLRNRRFVTPHAVPEGATAAGLSDMHLVDQCKEVQRRSAVVADGPYAVVRRPPAAAATPAAAPGGPTSTPQCHDGALLAAGIACWLHANWRAVCGPAVRPALCERGASLRKYSSADGPNPLASKKAVAEFEHAGVPVVRMWAVAPNDPRTPDAAVIVTRPVGTRVQSEAATLASDPGFFGPFYVSSEGKKNRRGAAGTAAATGEGSAAAGGTSSRPVVYAGKVHVVTTCKDGQRQRGVAFARGPRGVLPALQVARDAGALLCARLQRGRADVHVITCNVILLCQQANGDTGTPVQFCVLMPVLLYAATVAEQQLHPGSSVANCVGFCAGRLMRILGSVLVRVPGALYKETRLAAMAVMLAMAKIDRGPFHTGVRRATPAADVAAGLNLDGSADRIAALYLTSLFHKDCSEPAAQRLRHLAMFTCAEPGQSGPADAPTTEAGAEGPAEEAGTSAATSPALRSERPPTHVQERAGPAHAAAKHRTAAPSAAVDALPAAPDCRPRGAHSRIDAAAQQQPVAGGLPMRVDGVAAVPVDPRSEARVEAMLELWGRSPSPQPVPASPKPPRKKQKRPKITLGSGSPALRLSGSQAQASAAPVSPRRVCPAAPARPPSHAVPGTLQAAWAGASSSAAGPGVSAAAVDDRAAPVVKARWTAAAAPAAGGGCTAVAHAGSNTAARAALIANLRKRRADNTGPQTVGLGPSQEQTSDTDARQTPPALPSCDDCDLVLPCSAPRQHGTAGGDAEEARLARAAAARTGGQQRLGLSARAARAPAGGSRSGSRSPPAGLQRSDTPQRTPDHPAQPGVVAVKLEDDEENIVRGTTWLDGQLYDLVSADEDPPPPQGAGRVAAGTAGGAADFDFTAAAPFLAAGLGDAPAVDCAALDSPAAASSGAQAAGTSCTARDGQHLRAQIADIAHHRSSAGSRGARSGADFPGGPSIPQMQAGQQREPINPPLAAAVAPVDGLVRSDAAGDGPGPQAAAPSSAMPSAASAAGSAFHAPRLPAIAPPCTPAASLPVAPPGASSHLAEAMAQAQALATAGTLPPALAGVLAQLLGAAPAAMGAPNTPAAAEPAPASAAPAQAAVAATLGSPAPPAVPAAVEPAGAAVAPAPGSAGLAHVVAAAAPAASAPMEAAAAAAVASGAPGNPGIAEPCAALGGVAPVDAGAAAATPAAVEGAAADAAPAIVQGAVAAGPEAEVFMIEGSSDDEGPPMAPPPQVLPPPQPAAPAPQQAAAADVVSRPRDPPLTDMQASQHQDSIDRYIYSVDAAAAADANAIRTVSPQEVLSALTEFNAVYVIGSGGSGKTHAAKQIEELAVGMYGRAKVARVANSCKVAVNANCKTIAKAFNYGVYDAQRQPRYNGMQKAMEVAALQVILWEESSSIGGMLIVKHLHALRDAKLQCNYDATKRGHPIPFPNVHSPFHGVKMIFFGDTMQQLHGLFGVGSVSMHGTPAPFSAPAAHTGTMWEAAPFRHAAARVAVLIVHGNFRLQGILHEMHSTGQSGMMSAASFARLESRTVSLTNPTWFVKYTWPTRAPDHPLYVPLDVPRQPYTVIGLTSAETAEAVYWEDVRPQAAYQHAYGLLAVGDPAAAQVVKQGVDVVHVPYRRVDRFWFRDDESTAYLRSQAKSAVKLFDHVVIARREVYRITHGVNGIVAGSYATVSSWVPTQLHVMVRAAASFLDMQVKDWRERVGYVGPGLDGLDQGALQPGVLLDQIRSMLLEVVGGATVLENADGAQKYYLPRVRASAGRGTRPQSTVMYPVVVASLEMDDVQHRPRLTHAHAAMPLTPAVIHAAGDTLSMSLAAGDGQMLAHIPLVDNRPEEETATAAAVLLSRNSRMEDLAITDASSINPGMLRHGMHLRNLKDHVRQRAGRWSVRHVRLQHADGAVATAAAPAGAPGGGAP
eukprot:jgi/Ulvmu1/10661/UM066_0043.1